MKKRILSLAFVIIVFSYLLFAIPASADADNITVTLNGTALSFEQPPVIADDRTLAPLCDSFEALGAEVSWSDDTKTVTATKDSTEIKLTVGSNIMYKVTDAKSEEIKLDVTAGLINDKTMVPLRAIAEAFDCYVFWNGDTNTVKIISDISHLLSESATKYNNDLALICADQSKEIENVYALNDKDRIIKAYKKLGIKQENIYTLDDNSESYYYSLACLKDAKINNESYNVLFITARGTGFDFRRSALEILNNKISLHNKDFFGYEAYANSYHFCEKIMSGLENEFLPKNEFLKSGKLKVIITGHSLGGSSANLVAAMFNMSKQEWWSDITAKDDIYCYTFGGISSISGCYYLSDEGNSDKAHDIPVTDEFENIHNIYNYYDSFGPNQINPLQSDRDNTYDKRFGHIELFGNSQEWHDKYDATKSDEYRQHNMNTYIDALENHDLSGLDTCN